jgi:4-diphosphocytidyl-2-C-methyl-D-erythritol kinase
MAIRCPNAAIPEDHTNLAYHAADLFFRELGIKPALAGANSSRGLVITINKNIPVGAGLGGGSSNAASVLTALNQNHGRPLPDTVLKRLGLAIGADVPFFLFQKPAIAQGVGEKLQHYEKLRHFTLVLICPAVAVSTAEVYKKLNLRLTNCKKKLKNFPFETPVFNAGKHLCNDLETVTTALCPEIRKIKQKLLEMKAAGASMSGSGPSVFGLFYDPVTARIAYDSLSKNSNWQVWVAEPLL